MCEEKVYKVCFIVRIGDSVGRTEFEESATCEDDAVVLAYSSLLCSLKDCGMLYSASVCLSSVRAVR